MENFFQRFVGRSEEAAGTLKKVASVREEVIGVNVDRIRKKYEKIEEEIAKLMEEKLELIRLPATKTELLVLVKETYRTHRERARELFIKNMINDAYQGRALPFSDVAMRMLLNKDSEAWYLLFLLVREEDLEEVIAELPEIGIPSAVRETKIKKIDQEITKLSKLLEGDLQELRK
jgi:hypothetical protein